MGVWTHSPATQLSSVHGLLSLQLIGVPAHEPPPQTSPVVQASPSLHASEFGVKTH